MAALFVGGAGRGSQRGPDPIVLNAESMLAEGRQTFRFDTFGDEAFWGGTLRLHEAVATLSPRQALSLGLKVDSEALPNQLRQQLRQGRVNLNDPAVTSVLLGYNAVVGVKGSFANGRLATIGITCALCHSTVDDSIAPGVGRRLDGWANRDLNIGAIIAAAPSLDPLAKVLGAPVETVRSVLLSWARGSLTPSSSWTGRRSSPMGGRPPRSSRRPSGSPA